MPWQENRLSVSTRRRFRAGRWLPEPGTESPSVPPTVRLDSFLIGTGNQLAHHAVRELVEGSRPRQGTLGPIVLHGGLGLGKSHLLSGAAEALQQQDKHRKVNHLTTERFVRRLTRAIRQKELFRFQEQLQASEVFVMDDLERLSGMKRTQFELLCALDALLEHGRPLLLAGSLHPGKMEGLDPRLADRLASGLVLELLPPDHELRLTLVRRFLQTFTEPEHPPVEEGVVTLLAERGPVSVRGLKGLCRQIAFEARIQGKELDVPFCQSRWESLESPGNLEHP